MDWKTFFVEILKALAWPAVAGAALWLLRVPIIALLARVSEVSVGGVKTTFQRGLDDAERLEREIPAVEGEPPGDMRPAERDEIAIAANPTGVIMEAWIKLSAAAQLVLSPGNALLAISGETRKDPIRDLERSGRLSASERSLVSTLRELRNMAAHSTSRRPTAADAARFVEIADNLEQRWIFRAAQTAHAAAGRD